MELSRKVQEFIQNETDGKGLKNLKKSFETLSKKYINEEKNSEFVTNEEDSLVYALSRMLATYNVNYFVAKDLLYLIQQYKLEEIETLTDVGCGTLAGSLAFNDVFCLSKTIGLEKNGFMLNFSRKMVQNCSLANYELKDCDMTNQPIDSSDIILASFSLNELKDEKLFCVLDKLVSSTKKYLVIVEAGTPKRFEFMKMIKNYILPKGLSLVAPCANVKECPISGDDWCHFYCRLNRTKEQKFFKDATKSYEDEKFTYLIFSKQKFVANYSRIIARPQVRKGVISFKICSLNGVFKKDVTAKEKQMFKMAKKLDCGNIFLQEENVKNDKIDS